MKLNYYPSLIAACLLITVGYGQSTSSLITSDTIVVQMQKATGFGPNGNASFVIGPKNGYDPEEQKGFQVMKNVPENLTDGVEYFFILDYLQFYYQNYRQGIYSKE